MINVGVLGCGYWGSKLVRVFNENPNCNLKIVVDLNVNNLKGINVTTSMDYEDLFSNDIDAVAIALPANTHYHYAKLFMEKGKHVFVEKPFAKSKKEADELVELSFKSRSILMVDHTFLYTPAVKWMGSFIKGEKNEPYCFDSVRTNFGLFQKDINVMWDLSPHDFSILSYLIDERPYSVHAFGSSHTKNKIEDTVSIVLRYQSNRIA